jgi:hypothetical protein
VKSPTGLSLLNVGMLAVFCGYLSVQRWTFLSQAAVGPAQRRESRHVAFRGRSVTTGTLCFICGSNCNRHTKNS